MKKSLLLLPLLLLAAAPSPITPHQLEFDWLPDNTSFGGLSTNEFYQYITFNIYSVTDVTTPTNNWPLVTNYLASDFPSFDGHWTNTINIDGNTRFYMMNVGVANGNSPFSPVFTSIPIQKPGVIKRVK